MFRKRIADFFKQLIAEIREATAKAEATGMDGEEKRQMAVDIIVEKLDTRLGDGIEAVIVGFAIDIFIQGVNTQLDKFEEE